MKIKQLLCVLLATLMIVPLAACGEDTQPPADDTTTTAADTTTAESTTEAPPPPEYEPAGVKYDGQTVTFTGYNYTGNWVLLNYHAGLLEETGDVINDAIVKRNRKVEEELGVKLNMIALGKNDRDKTTVLEKYIQAQDDVLNFAMQMNCGLSKILTTKGLVQNLKSISTLDLDKSWWNQSANEEYTINGTQYAAVGDMCLLNLGAPVVVYFAKDLIKNNKLADPYQLVYDGKWTIDKMYEMAEAADRDVDGNGAPDKTDVFGFATEHDTLYYGLYGAGVRFSTRDKDGNPALSLYNEKAVSYAEKMVKLIRDKDTSLYYEEWKKGYSNAHSDFFMPKLMANELLFYSNQLLVTLNLREMESDFGIVPMPKNDEKQENYISIANTYFSDHVVVPATCGRLEQTGHLLDAMGYYAQQYITPAFIDQSIKLKGVRDEDSLNMINLIHETQVFDVGLMFDWGGMIQMLRDMVIKGETNFASRWEGIKTKAETALKTTLDSLK